MDTNSKKYKTIMADPPYSTHQRGHYGAINHYDLMSLDRIKEMPVADLLWQDLPHGGRLHQTNDEPGNLLKTVGRSGWRRDRRICRAVQNHN